MKKFLKNFLILVIALIPMFSVFASAAYIYETGTIDTHIKALGNNTQLCAVEKKSTENYSKVKFLRNGSTFSTANVWVMTSDKTWMSDKIVALPDEQKIKITYNPEDPSLTFAVGSNVIFWGEQTSATAKKAVGTAYGF